MAFSLVAHVGGTGVGTFTTGAIDTRGADLIVLHVSQSTFFATATVSDSKSNTYTPLTAQLSGFLLSQLYYVAAPTVDSAHTFTLTGGANIFAAVEVQAWSGSNATPFDVENGNIVDATTSISTGSVTPGQANELIVAGLCFDASNTVSIDSSFTISDQNNFSSGVNEGGAMAYLVQGSASAVNPTWSWSTSTNARATIATFKAAATGGIPWVPPQQGADNLMRQIRMIKTDR